MLTTLGFFTHDQENLKRIATTLSRMTDPETRPLAESILPRIYELGSGPGHLVAHDALAAIERERDSGRRWWVPEDIPAPPSREPAATGPTEVSRADVDRVLTDLGARFVSDRRAEL